MKKILDISKIAITYFANDAEAIESNGVVKVQSDLKEFQIEDSDVQAVEIMTNIYVHHNSDVFKDFDSLDGEEDTEIVDENEIDALLKLKFKIVYSNEEKEENMDVKEALSIIEPYLRLELMTFCDGIGIPTISLPYKVWD